MLRYTNILHNHQQWNQQVVTSLSNTVLNSFSNIFSYGAGSYESVTTRMMEQGSFSYQILIVYSSSSGGALHRFFRYQNIDNPIRLDFICARATQILGTQKFNITLHRHGHLFQFLSITSLHPKDLCFLDGFSHDRVIFLYCLQPRNLISSGVSDFWHQIATCFAFEGVIC